MTDYDFTELDEKAAEFQDGWDKLCEMLAEDEAFAHEFFENFHGSEY